MPVVYNRPIIINCLIKMFKIKKVLTFVNLNIVKMKSPKKFVFVELCARSRESKKRMQVIAAKPR